MTIRLLEPYGKRPLRFLELWSCEGHRLKVYAILYRCDRPHPDLLAAAKRVAARHLRDHPLAGRAHGVGILGVHDGRGENFVFLDRWADENELHHTVFVSPKDRPADLVPASPAHASVCVWDLEVQHFERDAWVECVLANPAGPDLEAYLARRLDGIA